MLTLFASVKNRVYVLLTFKGLLFLSVIHHLLSLKQATPITAWLFIILVGVNDCIRGRSWLHPADAQRKFLYSMLISIILLAALHLSLPTVGISALIQLNLIELLIFSGRLSHLLVGLNFVAYVLPSLLSESALDQYGDNLINYAGFFVVGLLFRNIIAEKVKTENLYRELQDANRKLKLYSDAVEELTISKERTRIAQELHDSIGHSFIALSMNLEFAHHAVDRYPDKAKEVLAKTQVISKEGMSQLRKAVDTLNQTFQVEHLKHSLIELFGNFDQTAKIQFCLEMDELIEDELPKIKECLFKTVREALTNGIRHGEATKFTIRIRRSTDGVNMIINNNGRTNGPVLKSHGLLGMERRIIALGGHMSFYTAEGFNIEVQIPSISLDFDRFEHKLT
jgi:signal transduction histidine kinase